MLKARKISYYGYVILSVLLLWAFMLCAQDVLAIDAQHSAEQGVPASGELPFSSNKAEIHLKQQGQKVSAEAIASNVTVSLHQAVVLRLPAFAAPTDEEIPSFMAKWNRGGFLARLCPIIIQPNAP